jgi:hypothetical protein
MGRRVSMGGEVLTNVGKVFAVVGGFLMVGSDLEASYSWKSIHRRCKAVHN